MQPFRVIELCMVGGKLGFNEIEEFLLLFGTRDTRDDVTGQAAKNSGSVSGHVDIGNDRADDGDEGVTVEVAERGHPVAFAAKFDSINETHLGPMPIFPKDPGRFMAVARRAVEGSFRRTEKPVRLDDDGPWHQGEPRPFQFRSSECFLAD